MRNRHYQITVLTDRPLVEAFDAAKGHSRYGSRSALINAFMQDFIDGHLTPRVRASLQRLDQPTTEEARLLATRAEHARIAREFDLPTTNEDS